MRNVRFPWHSIPSKTRHSIDVCSTSSYFSPPNRRPFLFYLTEQDNQIEKNEKTKLLLDMNEFRFLEYLESIHIDNNLMEEIDIEQVENTDFDWI